MAKSRHDLILDKYGGHSMFARQDEYAKRVGTRFDGAVSSLLDLARPVLDQYGKKRFSFDDNPRIRKETQKVIQRLYTQVYDEIQRGCEAEWEYANLSCDLLVRSVFNFQPKEKNLFSRYFERNRQALDAFYDRRSQNGGMNLSQYVWKYTGDLKEEMEMALTASIGEGMSAASISRQVRQYLQHPDKLFRRVRGSDGELHLSANAKAFHPGRGVYRSSYKNAMRLARTETNAAYRTADEDRWMRMDFVVGIEVCLSNNHLDDDICDGLCGKYPKDFKYTAWHPQCRCYVIPILASKEERRAQRMEMLNGNEFARIENSVNEIKSIPDVFSKWIDNNTERLAKNGYRPYFIADNPKYAWSVLSDKERKIALGPNGVIARRRHLMRNDNEVISRAVQAHPNLFPEDIRDRYLSSTPSGLEVPEEVRRKTLTLKTAENVARVAEHYPELQKDVEDLRNLLSGTSYGKIGAYYRELAKKVSVIKKEESFLGEVIPDAHNWKKKFSVDELKATRQAVLDRISKMPKSLEGLKHDLEYEIKWVEDHKKYSTWEVAKASYEKKLAEVKFEIEWKDVKTKVSSLRSSVGKGFDKEILAIEDAIKAGKKAEAKALISEMERYESVIASLKDMKAYSTTDIAFKDTIDHLNSVITKRDIAKAETLVSDLKVQKARLEKIEANWSSVRTDLAEATSAIAKSKEYLSATKLEEYTNELEKAVREGRLKDAEAIRKKVVLQKIKLDDIVKDWSEIETHLADEKAWMVAVKTKSKPYRLLVSELEKAIADKDLAKAKTLSGQIKTKRAELAKKAGVSSGAKIKKETIAQLKKRLGSNCPATLENFDDILRQTDGLYIKEIVKSGYITQKEAEEWLVELSKAFDKYEFGMQIDPQYIEDSLKHHFKCLPETGRSGGAKSVPLRRKNESLWFGIDEQAEAKEFTKYGCLMDSDISLSMQNASAEWYGSAQVRFKKDKVNCTWTWEDSLDHCRPTTITGKNGQPSLVSDPKLESLGLNKYDKCRGRPDVSGSAKNLFDSMGSEYLELQYHGMLTSDAVASIAFKGQSTCQRYSSAIHIALDKKIPVHCYDTITGTLYKVSRNSNGDLVFIK